MLGHEYVIEQIALSNNGHHLVSAGHGRTVRVWDLSARRPLGDPLEAQSEYISAAMAWSPGGQFVVAGSTQGDIFLWDVSSLENSDTVTPPLLGAGNNPWPSTSRSQTSSLSPSLLDLPAGAPIRPNSNQPPRRDDFWDTSDLDLPARTRTQISTIPIAAVPFKPSIPRTSTAKAAPNVSSTSSTAPSAHNNVLGSIGARFRRDKHAPDPIGMQPPPPKTPKYSPVAKVALGQADARLYMDTSKDKKPGDDESVQEEWANVESDEYQ
ncbi:hypothetical protein BJ138DRAFT_1130274 [Hygrophoropsis aurantiaca]|uniref:Uncharacterized protein n=1 Tax=Hygrophoropsis aurantiaca TaxID=72124 RepID=A0ACB7ZY93_9AGAM|nr:hypothetical protein BJ138DRAFT_1130274 [Hygrophoropsis aurantiaca]